MRPAEKNADESKEGESTCLRDKSPSIMDVNPTDSKAWIASILGSGSSSVILPHYLSRAGIILTTRGLSSHVGVLLTSPQYSYSSSNYNFAGGAPATTITAQRGLHQGDVEVEGEEDQREPGSVWQNNTLRSQRPLFPMVTNPPPSSPPYCVGCEPIQRLLCAPRERCGGRLQGEAGDETPITILNIKLQRADYAGS